MDNEFFTKNEENLYAKHLEGGPSQVGEIKDLWAKIYIFFDAMPAACRKWLKVGFRKVQRVPIILVPKKNQNILWRLNDCTLKIVEKVAQRSLP